MSGMDRLTDEALVLIIDQLSRGNHRASLIEDAERAARELLAHRRASQADPAPSDGLREALEDARDVMAGVAEHILKADRVNTKGMFADLQRARLAADAALSASPTQEGDHRHD